MAGDRARLRGILDGASDVAFGYQLANVNAAPMSDDDFTQLVASCCEATGVPEPDDVGGVPREPEAFTDWFLSRWQG